MRYINIDKKSLYFLFNSFKILSSSQTISIKNVLQCCGISCKDIIKRHNKNFLLPELKIGNIKNGYICASGFIYVKDAILHSKLQFPEDAMDKQTKNDNYTKIINCNKIVPILRAGDHIYGHWLLDILPIVWLSRRYNNIENYKYVVRNNIPNFALELLSYFNVKKDDLILIDNNTRVNFNSALFVSNMRYDQAIHPMMKEFAKELKDKVLTKNSSINILNNCKIYLSRAKWKSDKINRLRELNNRKEVEEFFEKEKFSIIYPEELSFPEQVNIFSNIDTLAGEDGSALHNSIFMNEGSKVICLKGKKNQAIIQGSLCYIMGQKISYIIGDTENGEGDRNSAYSLDITNLNNFFKEC